MQGPLGASQNPIQELDGHGIGTESQETQEILTNVRRVYRRGRLRTISKVVKPMIHLSKTYPVAMNSDLWNPIIAAAEEGECKKDFFMRYVCPVDSEFQHVKIMVNGTLDPVSAPEDLVSASGDRAVLTGQTQITAEEQRFLYNLITSKVYTAGALAYNGITFLSSDCPSCNNDDGQDLIAVGGDAVAAPTITKTDDRFATVTNPTAGAAADVAYTIFESGSLLFMSQGDNADPGAATTASVYRSIDGGDNWIVDPDIDDVIRDFVEVERSVLAVGHTIAGLPVLWITNDRGGTWVELTNTLLSGTDGLTAVDYDHIRRKLYFVGEAGIFWAGKLTATGITLNDISAQLPGTPGNLSDVRVLDTDNVLVVGAAGYVAETWDGAATVLAVVPFPTSDAIAAMDGNKFRAVFGAGTVVYMRDILNGNEIEAITLEEGVTLTGNVTDVTMNVFDDMERFAIVTDVSETLIGIPPYPGG
jgi:photosystem II stability/assembly factor-like uncharacterized protein